MKRVALFIGVLLSGIAVSAQKNFLDVHYIEVTGTAEMEVVPDRIYLKIVIDEKDNKSKTSIDKLEEDMIAALKTIEGINISEDLKMKDLSSSMRYKIISDNQIFYRKEYELLVKNGKTASQVIKKLDKVGISKISIAKTDHSQIEELKKTVHKNAMKNAKEKAIYLAEAVGQSIGNALYINETMMSSRVRSACDMMAGVSVRKARSSDDEYEYNSEVEFTNIKISFSVDAKFELK